MFLKEIKLKNYRNLEDFKTNLSGSNLIIAKNGKGKTNLLESIFFAIYGSSFRKINDYLDFLKEKGSFLNVELEFDKNKVLLYLSKDTGKLNRRVAIDGKGTRHKSLILKFPMIIFAPTSVDLISGAPETRRKDLDNFISMLDPKFYDTLTRYNKTLKNRNAVIKNVQRGKSNPDEISFWTTKLIDSGTTIFEKRLEFVEKINKYINTVADNIFHDLEEIEIEYLSSLEATKETFKEIFTRKLSDNLQKEIVVGKTLYGVHKDDYAINFNEKNLRFFGSRGQQRLGSLLLKLSQAYITTKSLDTEDLVLLIDDLMSELDTEHRNKVAKYLDSTKYQKIYTGAVESEFPEWLLKSSSIIYL